MSTATTGRWIEPVTLEGKAVRLVPLEVADTPAIGEAVTDGRLWELWYTTVPSPETAVAWVATALEQREQTGSLPFTIRDPATDRIIGCTRYFNVAAEHGRVEIGHTWYRASVQRSAANTEAKLLLLGHAFDRLGCHGVELRTHHLNVASRRAIERLGARLDGILRQHQVMPDGSLRDTCVYSIVAAEWPAVRSNLTFRLSRHE
ncbi:MAG: GNAT family protein [Burkholderiaceae bacterium]